MANSLGLTMSPLGHNPIRSETPWGHSDGVVRYALRRCYVCRDVLEKLPKEDSIMSGFSAPPENSLFCRKGLETREVEVSSSCQGPTTILRKVSEASEAEIEAELEKMNERIQNDYKRLCEYRSQLMEFIQFARQTETILKEDILFYTKAFLSLPKDQQALEVTTNELHQKTKMFEAIDQEVSEPARKFQKLTLPLEEIKKPMKRLHDEQEAKALVDEKIKNLEKHVSEYRSRISRMSSILSETEKEKNKISKDNDYYLALLKKEYARRSDRENQIVRELEEQTEKQSKRIKNLRKCVARYKSDYQTQSNKVKRLRKLAVQNKFRFETDKAIKKKLSDEKDALSRRVEELTNELHHQTALLEGKQKQLSNTVSQNAHFMKLLNHSSNFHRIREPELIKSKKMLSQLQSELEEKKAELSSWDTESIQWDIDRAVMKKKMKTLRAKLRALSIDNQTTDTEAALDEAR
ncbi:hypothetical protein [Endozoicomonas sp. 8E]|uniref:hypothetical protein n=1 Tax=Endozoicomonas sp. 8E TaxID=3035692 RepID=UPI002938F59E|nr:hypothetical protein [Endozoicomonas sp. 8E]WOG27621.1 hypothetical protein P6910_24245 [Endozoicomonas sp. 8E]